MFKRLLNGLVDKAEDAILDVAVQKLSPYVEDAVSGAIDGIMNSGPAVRSTGGATATLLKQIQSDFNDFHPDDADADIQTFVLELLQIRFCGKEKFEKAKVSEKIELNINRMPSKISDVKINQIAISNYVKTQNSATITYRISVGYNQGGTRREKLYEVDYTLQLRDEFGGMQFLECAVCGAPLEENTGYCKYCGTKHIRDTISNWVVTGFTEK